jgi:hypothetical protein
MPQLHAPCLKWGFLHAALLAWVGCALKLCGDLMAAVVGMRGSVADEGSPFRLRALTSKRKPEPRLNNTHSW